MNSMKAIDLVLAYCRNKRLIIQVDKFLNYDGVTDAVRAGLVRVIHVFLKSQSI